MAWASPSQELECLSVGHLLKFVPISASNCWTRLTCSPSTCVRSIPVRATSWGRTSNATSAQGRPAHPRHFGGGCPGRAQNPHTPSHRVVARRTRPGVCSRRCPYGVASAAAEAVAAIFATVVPMAGPTTAKTHTVSRAINSNAAMMTPITSRRVRPEEAGFATFMGEPFLTQ
jgi:hypothetical protein